MSARRVVITGMGGVTALGSSWAEVEPRLRALKNAVKRMPEWDRHGELLHTRLAAPIEGFDPQDRYPRKTTRSMGRVSLLALRASELALEQAGLLGDAALKDGRTGIAYGSSSGSIDPVRVFGQMLTTGSMQGVTSTSYLQMMPHTTAVNVGLYFALKGRVIPTSSACTSGSQGIGYAYEAVKSGKQALMIAGGAEELSAPAAAVFDTLFATSTKNDSPEATPRPFDKGRDGLVVGEGAASLIVEDLEHARARGATPLAEIVGFGTNSDGSHITQPDAQEQARAIRLALDDAGLPPSAIGYVSAHGTATDRGDVSEARATREVLGSKAPVSTVKSYIGHTLGACGAIEAWWTIEMMRAGWFAPTLNLETPDAECGELDHVTGVGRQLEVEHVLKNNFAFGGINTSLVFRRL
ncbi:MAG: beta-ketoacyl-ACP synthase [Burkholderiales bacterium]